MTRKRKTISPEQAATNLERAAAAIEQGAMPSMVWFADVELMLAERPDLEYFRVVSGPANEHVRHKLQRKEIR